MVPWWFRLSVTLPGTQHIPNLPCCMLLRWLGRVNTRHPSLPARKGAIFSPRSELLLGGSMRVAIIADDLTGAADTGVQLARAGYRTAVAFRGAPIPPSEDLDAVALDTDSRAMPAGFAARRVLAATRAVRATPLIYKKLDSTL